MSERRIEESGTFHGLEYEVVATSMGHRCGYVRIPEGHPLFGLDYGHAAPAVSMADLEGECVGKRGVMSLLHSGGPEAKDVRLDLLFDVHGSLTFAGPRHAQTDWWLGFDCAHAGDAPDPELMSPELYGLRFRDPGDLIRSREYVSAECERLAKQVAERYPLETKEAAQ